MTAQPILGFTAPYGAWAEIYDHGVQEPSGGHRYDLHVEGRFHTRFSVPASWPVDLDRLKRDALQAIADEPFEAAS